MTEAKKKEIARRQIERRLQKRAGRRVGPGSESLRERDRQVSAMGGYLIGGQAKIAAKAPPTNKIDEKDFAVLRAEKAAKRGKGLQDEKMKPGKVMKAKEGKSVLGGANKPPKIKLTGLGSVLGGKGGPAGRDAKSYRKYLKGLAAATKFSGIRKPDKFEKFLPKPVLPKQAKKLGSSKFIQRRMQLGGGDALKAFKATRVGKIAAGVAAAALLAKAGLEKMYEKRTGKKPFTKREKKMGGGMMKKPMGYDKGGDAFLKRRMKLADFKKIGTYLPGRMKILVPAGVALGVAASKGADKMREKLKEMKKNKKMGGGMMMRRPMMANKGVMTLKDKQEKKLVQRLANAPKGGNRGRARDVVKGLGGYMGGGLTEATQKLKAQGKMGGGMMQRPMMAMGGGMMPGYKKGKSVMAKGCKLGRKKPTKMYTQEGECPSKESYRAQVD